jgi:hypothetical protein
MRWPLVIYSDTSDRQQDLDNSDMRTTYYITVLLLCFQTICGQSFFVSRVPFSSRLTNEFGPVYFKNGIVFCSNMRDNSPVGYTGEDGRLYRLFFIEGSDTTGWKKPVLLSKELTSGFNDGPATFSADYSTIFFSRNNNTGNNLRNSTDMSNKLGLYISRLEGERWNDPVPLPFNNKDHFFSTPSLSPDGSRLYFSSDMPGGSGGMDLYCCEKNGDGWSAPENLGPVVNTPYSESFPFADHNGILWFASDGHKGFGKKDIYYTSRHNGEWMEPVNLDSTINTSSDDFGLVLDGTGNSGYFSSDRLGSDDLYRFRIAPPDFEQCDTVRENRYCFTFFDEHHHSIDSISVKYLWDFGKGHVQEGLESYYCFPGPGKYSVRLTVVDELTGDTISKNVNYDVDLKDIEQVYIKVPARVKKGEIAEFDGTRINLPHFSVTGYFWDFGDGFTSGGPVAKKSFEKGGDHYVRIGLTGKSDRGGPLKKCYIRKIKVN